MKRLILLLLLLGISLTIVSTVRAENGVNSEIELTEEEIQMASYTPDHPFYGLERAMERLRLIFAGGDEAKARLRVQHAYERLLEARVMIQKGKTQYLTRLVNDYSESVVNAEASITKIEARGQNATQLRAHVEEMTGKHINVLEQIMVGAPESAQQGLQTAINNAQQRQERMRAQFTGGDQGQQQNGQQKGQEDEQEQPSEQDVMCVVDDDCQLSLCDCECYKTGETPEDLYGFLCGINCAAEYNVIGCECVDDICKTIPANINPGGQDNQPQ